MLLVQNQVTSPARRTTNLSSGLACGVPGTLPDSALGGGESTVALTIADGLIWFAVVGVVGALNAGMIYLANRGAFWFAARRKR